MFTLEQESTTMQAATVCEAELNSQMGMLVLVDISMSFRLEIYLLFTNAYA